MFRLEPATLGDLEELMTWFPDRRSVDLWSGPDFRFPFTLESFIEDCYWDEFGGQRLLCGDGVLAAFGQFTERYGRSHLARLIANPAMRGQGVGRALVNALMSRATETYGHDECGLFVYRHNAPALNCYQSAGFEIFDYPEDAPMPEMCFYLTRKIQQGEDDE